MIASPHIATVTPLLVALALTVGTIVIHGIMLANTIRFVRHQRLIGVAGVHFWIDMTIVSGVVTACFTAHMIEMAIWALTLHFIGQFPDFGSAFYHSAENYTTLGYGDMVMSPSWRLLGPLEASTGMLMFGVSTAVIFAVIQWLFQSRVASEESF